MNLYEDVRALAAVDFDSPVSSFLKAALLPNQDAGQTVTEIVSGQDITFTAPLVWNADGSVTQNELVANGEKQTLPISPSADLNTDDVIVVIHSINNSSNGGNKAPMLGWYGTGARDLVVQSYTWGVNTRATVKESWETITVNSTKNAASSNEFVLYHWVNATNTLNQYEDGLLTGSVTGTKNASNPLTTLKLSLGLANDKFYSSQLYSKTGAFTSIELDDILNDPYGVFQSAAAVKPAIKITAVVAQQLEQAEVSSVSVAHALTCVVAHQIEQASAVQINSMQSIQGVEAQQLEQASTISVDLNQSIGSVIGQQLEHALTRDISVSYSLTSVNAQQIEQGVVNTISTSNALTSVAGVQHEHANTIALTDSVNLICAVGQQVEQGLVTDVAASYSVSTVEAEQIEVAIPATLLTHSAIFAVTAQQLEQASQISFSVAPKIKFLLDEEHLTLLSTTRKHHALISTPVYDIKQTTPQYKIIKV